jgi:uncharacterized repeat protein (TIGR03803 family)
MISEPCGSGTKICVCRATSPLIWILVLFPILLPSSAGAQVHLPTFRLLHAFRGGADGANAYTSLVQDSAGNFYGTTSSGGSARRGTVFKIDTTGNETVLHSFTGGADGESPAAGLVLDPAGNLYGTTGYGGSSGLGTVFKVDTSGNETVLYNFTGGIGGPDGANPLAGVILDPAGNLYGTTYLGGASGAGTVFEVDTNGKETVLYSFAGGVDGAISGAELVRDPAGNLYGTTLYGGPSDGGTVFKLDTSGKEIVLHSFTGSATGDGANPYAGLFRDAAGNLYGTTYYGGVSGNCTDGCGTVFKLDTTGKETVLHSFVGRADGANPAAGLIRDPVGNLYGTTAYGGRSGFGTVFKLDPNGKETLLHSFIGTPDGATPYANLVRDAAGNLYGTTFHGGAYRFGTVFKLTP